MCLDLVTPPTLLQPKQPDLDRPDREDGRSGSVSVEEVCTCPIDSPASSHHNTTPLHRRSLPDWVLSDTEREVIRKKTAGYEAKAAAKRKLRDDNMGDQAKLRRLSSALSTDAPAAVPAPLLAAGSAATSEEGVEPSSP